MKASRSRVWSGEHRSLPGGHRGAGPLAPDGRAVAARLDGGDGLTEGPMSERLSALTAAIGCPPADGEPVSHLGARATRRGRRVGSRATPRSSTAWTPTSSPSTSTNRWISSPNSWSGTTFATSWSRTPTTDLVGLVSQRKLLGLVGTYHPEEAETPLPVSEIMQSDPVTRHPGDPDPRGHRADAQERMGLHAGGQRRPPGRRAHGEPA